MGPWNTSGTSHHPSVLCRSWTGLSSILHSLRFSLQHSLKFWICWVFLNMVEGSLWRPTQVWDAAHSGHGGDLWPRSRCSHWRKDWTCMCTSSVLHWQYHVIQAGSSGGLGEVDRCQGRLLPLCLWVHFQQRPSSWGHVRNISSLCSCQDCISTEWIRHTIITELIIIHNGAVNRGGALDRLWHTDGFSPFSKMTLHPSAPRGMSTPWTPAFPGQQNRKTTLISAMIQSFYNQKGNSISFVSKGNGLAHRAAWTPLLTDLLDEIEIKNDFYLLCPGQEDTDALLHDLRTYILCG